MGKKAVDLVPAELTWKERRARAREITAATRAEREARKKADLVLPPGPAGALGIGMEIGGYWNTVRMEVEPHRATSQQLAGIYPFVADSGIGSTGPIVGVDLNADSLFHFSPWDAYADPSERGTFSTNILVIGAYRAGKSGTIKILVYRSLAFNYQAVVPSDPKGEWVKIARSVNGSVIRPGGPEGHRINPLARAPRRAGITDDAYETFVQSQRQTTLVMVLEKANDDAPLKPAESAAVTLALSLAIAATDDNPTLVEVHRQILRIGAGDVEAKEPVIRAAATVELLLDRFITGDLSGLFEGPSTVEFDQDAPIVVIDTSELFSRSETVAQIAQICATSWIQAVVSDKASKRRRYVIREEGWRDMTSVRALQMYQQWLKLSRDYGISNVVILHKVGDVDAVGEEGSRERNLAYSVIGDIENKFVFRVNQQEESNLRARLNIPPGHAHMARRLRKGEFIAYIGNFAYVVDCFATSTTEEYELFKTDDAVMTDRSVPLAELEPLYDIDEVWPEPSDNGQGDLGAWLEAASGGGEAA